jgi:hypothetical protein
MENKPLTINGCCDNINITSGNTIVMFGTHRFNVNIVYCKTCGSTKATSNIQHMRENRDEYVRQSVSR